MLKKMTILEEGGSNKSHGIEQSDGVGLEGAKYKPISSTSKV